MVNTVLMETRVFAPAKINLFLHVTGKRPDGYHTLNTLICFTDLGDELFLSDGAYALSVEGAYAAHAPADESNLVTRAVRAMEAAAGKKADMRVRLVKHVPAGAGLGGGSADAAAIMHALNARWGKPFTTAQLQGIGVGLGAELPVCLAGGAHFVSGIGESLAPAKLPPFAAVVAWPGKTLSTKDVFAVFDARFSAPLVMPDKITRAWIDAQRNDLSDAAIQLQPAVRTAMDETGGRMSGSGSAVFALCADAKEAKEKAAALAARHPAWWVRACTINADAA